MANEVHFLEQMPRFNYQFGQKAKAVSSKIEKRVSSKCVSVTCVTCGLLLILVWKATEKVRQWSTQFNNHWEVCQIWKKQLYFVEPKGATSILVYFEREIHGTSSNSLRLAEFPSGEV